MARSRIRLASAGLIVAVIAGVLAFVANNRTSDQPDGPASGLSGFIGSARPVLAEGSSFLDDEAGITGWARVSWDASSDATWNRIKGELATIEKEANDWAIGSYTLLDYPPDWDPHVWVHRDGWVVVYWPRDENPARLVDIKAGPNAPTLAATVISTFAAAGGAPTPAVSYYHFQQPGANRFVVAWKQLGSGGITFSITVPADVAMLTGGWAVLPCGGNIKYPDRFRKGSTLLYEGYPGSDPTRGSSIVGLGLMNTVDLPAGEAVAFTVSSSACAVTAVVMLVVREP